MKQFEAVIQTLEKLGGQATLGQLYQEVMKIKDCEWKTKTPFASIRRIVQDREEIFKVRPGLWALKSYKHRLGLEEYKKEIEDSEEHFEKGHSYYQGLLTEIGNFKGFHTFIPNQDKNKIYVNQPLAKIRNMEELPPFSYERLVNKAGTIDVSWFNERNLPSRFFEIEHSTNFVTSLLKFFDFRDFFVRMAIVASENREKEFIEHLSHDSMKEIASRIDFVGYDKLVRIYEQEFSKKENSYSL